MKIAIYLALVLVVVGLFARVYYLGGEKERLTKKGKDYEATISQLKKDNKTVGKLRAENLELSRRVTHAKRVFKKVQDPTGCYRAPIPAAADVQLRALYKSITGSS